MNLRDLYDYKNTLMEDLLTNENIVKLVNKDIPMEDAYQLAYEQIYPSEYIPDTIQEGKTYICFDVDIQRSYDKTFYAPVLYIWVFSHRSQLRLPDGGGVRTDALCAEICEMINGSRKYGLGELNIDSVKRFAPQIDYIGKCMVFTMKEFNKIYDPNKYTPVNRKGNNVNP